MEQPQKTSKKWILHTLVFLIIFGLLFVWVSYLFRPPTTDRKGLVGFYAEPENSLDVILIGGSSTYVYWAPYNAWHDYGFTSYDFSASSMSPALLKPLMQEAEKTQSPKLYVIDLRAFDVREEHPDFYSEEYLRNITDSMDYSVNRAKMVHDSYGYEQPALQYDPASYLDLMLYHSRWQELSEDSFKYASRDVAEPNKGFLFIKWALLAPFEKHDYSDVTDVLPLSEQTDQILHELLSYCRENDLPVLFTLNPYYQDSPTTKARYNYIEGVVNSYGYDFLDANEYYDEMNLDFSTDFYHRDHVNLYGAEKYTRFLGNYLKEHYALEDRRSDPAYQSWNEGYPGWVERCAEQKQLIDQAIADYRAAQSKGE